MKKLYALLTIVFFLSGFAFAQHYSNVDQLGDDNDADVSQTGFDQFSDIYQSSDDNNADVEQYDGDADEHDSYIVQSLT